MCVIIVCDTERIQRSEHEDASSIHTDGVGIAWRDDNTDAWRFYKGVEKKDYEKVFDLAQKVPMPHAIHYRMTSSGYTTAKLAQPFPIVRTQRHANRGTFHAGLMHNGHWSKGDTMADAMSDIEMTAWSDTKVAAAMMANRPVKKWARIIDKVGGKVVVFQHDGTIMMHGYGWVNENDGIHRSNDWHIIDYSTKYDPTREYNFASRGYLAGAQGDLTSFRWDEVEEKKQEIRDDWEVDFTPEVETKTSQKTKNREKTSKRKNNRKNKYFWSGKKNSYQKY